MSRIKLLNKMMELVNEINEVPSESNKKLLMSKFNELYMTLQPFKIDELNDIENLIAKTNKFLDCNVKERKRTNANVQGRMFLSTYLVDVIGMTTTRAGEIIGIDHSTVVHHRKTLKNLITIYPEIRDKWKNFLLYV